MRPLEVADFVRAMRIAVDNFGNEIGLIARSYLWHFNRRVGLRSAGAMWCKRGVSVSVAGASDVSFEVLRSFVHGRDVAWIDLAGLDDTALDTVLSAMQRWPRAHRLLVVRLDSARIRRFLAAGFTLAGELPDGGTKHVYLHATRQRIADASAPRARIRFGARRRMQSDCEFSVVERAGSIIGLTGVYELDFWRDVTWGAWGAMDPASARRDAVFETLRLTEERARAAGSSWFCLETSDCEKYRHARRIYELYGLQLMLAIPNFYDEPGSTETLMVYGKALKEPVRESVEPDLTPAIASERVLELAA